MANSSKGTIRVVVADDHPVMREMLVSLLAHYRDFEVVGAASDGAEAVELAGREDPDVILLNYRMPRMDGPQAAQEIRRRWPRIAVVGMSADSGDGETPPQMKQAGANAFVPKEAGLERIVATIRSVLAHEQPS